MTYPSTEAFLSMARCFEGGPKIFCETGTWHAHSLRRVKTLFERRISIEIDEALAKSARGLVPDEDAWILNGDSAELLPLVCRVITEPIFFWLDAHFCGVEAGGSNAGMPLMAELDAVLGRNQRKDIIAIDDLKQFGCVGREGIVDWRHITLKSVTDRLSAAGLSVDTSAGTYLVSRWPG